MINNTNNIKGHESEEHASNQWQTRKTGVTIITMNISVWYHHYYYFKLKPGQKSGQKYGILSCMPFDDDDDDDESPSHTSNQATEVGTSGTTA